MATMGNPPPGAVPVGDREVDPFSSNSSQDGHRQRYAGYDDLSFASFGSTSQTKRALEAHLAETERRLQEASQLGTVLVQQRAQLADRLSEIEAQQGDSEIGPELQKKLAELEKEFNEVGRETARAFIPKSRVPSGGEPNDNLGAPSVLSSEAAHSPSKVSVPSRKQRNQQPSRVHDIKLATEISSSLLSQLRELQAVLSEKDEALKSVDLEKSRLEIEVQGLNQRLRALDESEQRYKDENWTLETQVRELTDANRALSEREQRLALGLEVTRSQKSTLESKFEELKQLHGKLTEDHAVTTKQHETELSTLRRNVGASETEKGSLQRKIEELTSQNQELAKAISYRMRADEQAAARDTASESEDIDADRVTPEHSPPPSPSKATPRHGHLETETLKSSLHHAHRMIQNLKNNIHREKTEKLELKRMLQDARDELEAKRGDGVLNSASKRRKANSSQQDLFKKPAKPDRLGAARGSREEILLDEEWEEHDAEESPSRKARSNIAYTSSGVDTSTDAFETATEHSDAFETANEREVIETETDAFQTGAETLDGNSSDDLTETEAGPSVEGVSRGRRPAPLNRTSYMSTASTSADEFDDDVRTPVQNQTPRYRLKINRGGYRKSSHSNGDTPASSRDSPASFASTASPAPGQSLYAELGDLSDGESDEGSYAEGTPSRSRMVSREQSPELLRQSAINRTIAEHAAQPKVQMADSGMMTEPWEPGPNKSVLTNASNAVRTALAGGLVLGRDDKDETPPTRLHLSAISSQHTVPLNPITEEVQPKLLGVSTIVFQHTEPSTTTVKESPPIPFILSNIASQHTDPIDSTATRPKSFDISKIISQQTEPINSKIKESQPISLAVPTKSQPTPLHLSAITYQQTEPIEPIVKKVVPKPLGFSGVSSQHTEPVDAVRRTQFVFSTGNTLQSEPESPVIQKDRDYASAGGVSEIPTIKHNFPSTVVAKPASSISEIYSQHIAPSDPSRPSTAHRMVVPTRAAEGQDSPSDETRAKFEQRTSRDADGGKGGFLSSVFGWREPSSMTENDVVEEKPRYHTDQNESQTEKRSTYPSSTKEGRVPFAPIAANIAQGTAIPRDASPTRKPRAKLVDGGTQTMMSADELDKLLKKRRSSSGSVIAAPVPIKVPVSPSKTTFSPPSPRKTQYPTGEKPPRRPGSANSMRSRTASPPPLPADHKEVIAAAAQRSTTPTIGSMGPPILPASAYRTSGNMGSRGSSGLASPGRPDSRASATPRPIKVGVPRSEASASRRGSVSSFASEIDHRFNIKQNGGMPDPFGPGFNTDPRMIQAITQTMIGEYLWKYTRKAGRSEMSETRHRRFFWVHPYTRTLYWSATDPATAGKAQLKAKSVQIEAVRVITDDNPMPPGLHRKSLIIITPGRNVKFTATTGQRHETWFNALSYLLLRTSAEREDEGALTAEDVEEFNPGGYRSSSRMTGRSRASLSSYHSRTTRDASPNRIQQPSLTSRNPSTAQRASSVQPSGSLSGRLSSLSGMFRPQSTIRSSLSGRRSRQSTGHGEIYDASVVHDSAEDLRQVIQSQEREADRLENVRACCDGEFYISSSGSGPVSLTWFLGKHDVGSLTHKARHGSKTSRHSHSHNHNHTSSKGHHHHEAEMDPANYTN
ncbi:hypothetical protein M501DRAFT_939130 [Patellaria atrata CBS 101060]|uniref:PH domain-containing protein n=1 Tax=Patellaria atrata CBS 101060 TaxID=1346257 RepID=A0A9P4S670_9PEZI|nr:hypothetical protein M501DRAFT_939130 [Patellaria atrata CBS 101060]